MTISAFKPELNSSYVEPGSLISPLYALLRPARAGHIDQVMLVSPFMTEQGLVVGFQTQGKYELFNGRFLYTGSEPTALIVCELSPTQEVLGWTRMSQQEVGSATWAAFNAVLPYQPYSALHALRKARLARYLASLGQGTHEGPSFEQLLLKSDALTLEGLTGAALSARVMSAGVRAQKRMLQHWAQPSLYPGESLAQSLLVMSMLAKQYSMAKQAHEIMHLSALSRARLRHAAACIQEQFDTDQWLNWGKLYPFKAP